MPDSFWGDLEHNRVRSISVISTEAELGSFQLS
jgi:hypothetical protein